MSILSKLLMKEISMPYNCYEVGHTWTPSCSAAALQTGWSTFKEAIKLYAPLYLLTQAFQRKYDLDNFWKTIKSIVRSACFLGFNAFSFIIIFCLIRRIAGKFYYVLCAYLPAFLASAMALLIEREGRRGALAIYVTNIASETLFKMAVTRGIVKPLPNGEVIIFSISMAIFLYLAKSRGYQKDAVGSAFNFILGSEEAKARNRRKRKSNESEQRFVANLVKVKDAQLDAALRQIKRFKVLEAAISYLSQINDKLKHACCPHKSSCAVYVAKGALYPFLFGWFGHVLFKVVTGSRFWLRNPWSLISYPTRPRSLRFGIFLGSWAGIYKLASCSSRWLTGNDASWHALPCGFLSGLSMLSHPSPRLSLYLMWKVVEMVYCIAAKQDIVPWVQGTVTILYASSTAMLFYAALLEPHNMRPSYLRFLSQVTEKKFDKINRLVLDIFGTNASSMYRDFFPKLDPKYISRPFQETILVWL